MSTDNAKTLPLLSLRNLVLFPGAMMPVEIGRASSLRLIEALGGKGARVLVLGFTFKENVPDVRNTGVVSIVHTLRDYGVEVAVWDPHADPAEVQHEYAIELTDLDRIGEVDAVVLAVPHEGSAELALRRVSEHDVPVLIDVKGAIDRKRVPATTRYWRL